MIPSAPDVHEKENKIKKNWHSGDFGVVRCSALFRRKRSTRTSIGTRGLRQAHGGSQLSANICENVAADPDPDRGTPH